VGERVVKAEWDPSTRAFTGREAGPFVITSITRNGHACSGLLDGYVVLGLSNPEEDTSYLLHVIFEIRRALGDNGAYMLSDLPKAISLQLAGRKRLGALLHELAGHLGVAPIFGEVEGEPMLAAAQRLRAKAGEDPRLEEVLELIRSAHTTILMGSAPKAKADLGEAARLLAALMDGRA
jgi:hypothetical protein